MIAFGFQERGIDAVPHRRIELTITRCWLEGDQVSDDVQRSNLGSALRVELRNDTQYFDHGFSPVAEAKGATSVRRFLGLARTLIFEYQPSTREILYGGYYGQGLDYVKHTPITKWTIRLGADGADTYASDHLEGQLVSSRRLFYLAHNIIKWMRCCCIFYLPQLDGLDAQLLLGFPLSAGFVLKLSPIVPGFSRGERSYRV